MRVDITGRHLEITAPLRQLIDGRLAKLERLLNSNAISAQVILTKEKYRHRSEIIVHARGDHMLRGMGEGTAWPAALRAASAKIEQQALTLKGKWTDRRRRGTASRSPQPVEVPEPAGDAPRVVRRARYAVKPMSVDDAALRVESGPETFVVFRNADTDAVSIIYRRKDGNFGLIEPD